MSAAEGVKELVRAAPHMVALLVLTWLFLDFATDQAEERRRFEAEALESLLDNTKVLHRVVVVLDKLDQDLELILEEVEDE